MLTRLTFNIDPRLFNVVADLCGWAMGLLLAKFIVYTYITFLSLHVRKGHPIPLECLGREPQSVLSILQLMWKAGTSSAIICLIVLFLVAEFSHIASDADMKFVTNHERGDSAPVLALQLRNPALPLEFSGDPWNFRTAVVTYEEKDYIANAFMAAADGIAKGESPFAVGPAGADVKKATMAGVQTFGLTSNGEAIAAIDLNIPLVCNGMAEIKQSLSPFEGEIVLNNTASVPDCEFSSPRQNGIFDEVPSRVEIVGYARTKNYLPAIPDDPVSLIMTDGNATTRSFTVPRSERALARDRVPWTKGRRFTGFKGIVYGSERIDLGTVVIASGGEGPAQPLLDEFDNFKGWIRTTEYMFIGEIVGNCPVKPTYPGQPIPASAHAADPEEKCLAILTAECDTFPEDYIAVAIGLNFVSESSNCTLTTVEFVWGRNFALDSQLVAAVAGVYGRNKLSAKRPQQILNLGANSIPTALFTLASLEQLPSNSEKVQPEVGAVFFIFLLLVPLMACAVCFLVVKLAPVTLPIPHNGWEMLVLGREEDGGHVPTRLDCSKEFPTMKNHLKYGIVPNREAEFDHLGLGTETVRQVRELRGRGG
jgi:hypothetical protein